MSAYRHLSHDAAADQLAHDDGLAAKRQDALEAFCDEHYDCTLWVLERDPTRGHDLWGKLCEQGLPDDDLMNAALAHILVMPQQEWDRMLAIRPQRMVEKLTKLKHRLEQVIYDEAEELFDKMEANRGLDDADY